MALPSVKSISFQSSTGAKPLIVDSTWERLSQSPTSSPIQRLFSRSALVKRFAMVPGQTSDLTGLVQSPDLMSDSEGAPAPPTVSDVVRNLLDPTTLPHVILLGISGLALFLVSNSESDTLFAIGIAGYLGLTCGYALTAWMQEMDVVHRFSHFQPLPAETGFSEKIMFFCIRVVSSWISPLLLGSIPFAIIAIFLSSDTGQEQAIYWAMGLAGLFVVWSLAQGRALATSLRIFVEGRAVGIASIERNSRRLTSTTIHMGIIGIFATTMYWLLVSGAKDTSEMSIIEKMGPILFGLAAIAVQSLLFWYTTERRVKDSKRKDTAAFGFSWGLFMQLFVTWHLLSAYRRIVNEQWAILETIEELVLMVVTVVAAIWSLANGTHQRGFKLFNDKNAVFWGLSFGVAYSGSIAMISVLGSRLTDGALGTIGMSATIGIGHIITAGTMMWIHAWRIGELDHWLDSAREEIEVDEDESEEVPVESHEQDNGVSEIEILDEDLDIPDPIIEDDFFDQD